MTSPSTVSAAGPTLADQQRWNFCRALEIIDRSGAVELAERITRPAGPVGRPRYFTNRALLTGLLFTAIQHQTVTLTAVTRAINMLPDDCLASLGLGRDARTSWAVNLSQVDHAWNRLAEACNPSPLRDGKRIPRSTAAPAAEGFDPGRMTVSDPKYLNPGPVIPAAGSQASRAASNRGTLRDLDGETAAQRTADLHRLTDLILQATIPEWLRFKAVAVDWTDHDSTARATSGRRLSADPDARYGRRRRKPWSAPSPGPRKRRTTPAQAATTAPTAGSPTGAAVGPTLDGEGFETDKDELFFGYNIHVAAGVGDIDGPAIPELAVGLRLTAANDMAAVAPIAIDLLDTATAAGHPVDTLLVDLGYSMRSPANLHDPVADRGVWLVHDLERAKQGRLGTYQDAVLINGVPHCPFTPPATYPDGKPTPLTVPGSKATRDDWARYWDQRDRQDRYAFRPLGRRRPGACQRYQCPAAAGKVRCPFSPTSQRLPLDRPDVGLLVGPDQASLRCCDTSLTAPAEVGRAVRQEPVHGTRDWVRSYDRRSAVERYNAAVKAFGLERMDVRVLGLAKRSIAIAFAAAATNLRLLDATASSAVRRAA
ncbi:MAG: hypothetical protein M0Z30_20330 [Actinomycetota bacterium]|nr:hypothetical protein [Actinomycetota bacterium]